MSNDMGHGSSGYGNELTGISSRCQLKWFVVLNNINDTQWQQHGLLCGNEF